jgi:leucyl/phenylalanyl-tRNA---protein transferase
MGEDGLTAETVLRAYAAGLFPMAEDADDPGVFWVEPKERGILPLESVHLPARLIRSLRTHPFTIRIDHDFPAVIAACAESVPGREKTWINASIRALYETLFARGCCHSVEVYKDDVLVGGLYGVRLGGVFFGESMFHRFRDASKIALMNLIALLRRGGFVLLDTQFLTAHLAQFGAMSVPRKTYLGLLKAGINKDAVWPQTALVREDVLAVLQELHTKL